MLETDPGLRQKAETGVSRIVNQVVRDSIDADPWAGGDSQIVAIRIGDAEIGEPPRTLLQYPVDRVTARANTLVLRDDVIDLEDDLDPEPPVRAEASAGEVATDLWQFRDRSQTEDDIAPANAGIPIVLPEQREAEHVAVEEDRAVQILDEELHAKAHRIR